MRDDIKQVPLPEPQEPLVTLTPEQVIEKLQALGAPILPVDELVEFLEREDRVLADEEG